MLFMGIDVGTQGVRSIAADEDGRIAAAESVSFPRLNEASEPGLYEQNPSVWWECVKESVTKTAAALRHAGREPEEIAVLSVDGTSGTVLPVDEDGRPLTRALMYNDTRAAGKVEKVRSVAGTHERKLGLRFNASFSLPRIVWMMEESPDVYEKARRVIHQADYVVGMLCGEFGVSDYSNSLKSGYDLIDECWPAFFEKLGISRDKLPAIVPPGTPIGRITRKAAEELGLSTRTIVAAGATDGYASALAAGACREGDWASIIGTTLVIKGVSKDIVIDPTGAAYCHKLPGGGWLAGGASNVGGRCLNERFGTDRFAELNRQAELLAPTGILTYPLTGRGERYPFVDPQAESFTVGNPGDEGTLYTAMLEGVGYTERLCYELAGKAGCEVGNTIYTGGGACKSDVWLRIRASILNRTLKVPAVLDAAMGTCLIAAISRFGTLASAAENMLTFSKTVDPDPAAATRYEELYRRFEEECRRRFELGPQ